MFKGTITYRQLILIKNILVGILLILITMQSVLTYILALTLESKKTEIALFVDGITEKITQTHHSHLAFIESKIDNSINLLKKESKDLRRSLSDFHFSSSKYGIAVYLL